ncbi:hypothetical protein ACWCPO_31010, partial [Streptomyces albidoflavus]
MQNDVVPVARELIVVLPPLNAYIDRCNTGQCSGQPGEQRRVHEEFFLKERVLLHRAPQHHGIPVVAVPTQSCGHAHRPGEPEVADVAEEEGTTGRQEAEAFGDDVEEIVSIRK